MEVTDSVDRHECEKLHDSGLSIAEISNRSGHAKSKLRTWKARYEWGKKKPLHATKKRYNATEENGLQSTENENSKTNSTSSNGGAPLGNKNAIGNKGGTGGPVGNRKALTTGEYETLLLSDITDESERQIVETPLDTLLLQEAQIKKGLIRERRMLERIKAAENTHGGMVIGSVTKDSGITTIKYNKPKHSNHDSHDNNHDNNSNAINNRYKKSGGSDITEERENTQTITESTSKRVDRIEDSLTRVMAGTQRGIQHLYKMQSDIAGKESSADGITQAWIEGVISGKI